MKKSALDLIADCFTAEEVREAASFSVQSKEFAEFVEADVQYEQTAEDFEPSFIKPRRYAD